MPEDSEVVIRGKRLMLAAETMLPSGKRAWTRRQRTSQPSDPGVPQLARWLLSGPQGNSREDVSQGVGLLSVDWCDGVDTLYDALALPGPKVWPIDLVSLSQSEFVESILVEEETLTFASAASDDAVGAIAWANPTNALIDDATYASAAVGTSEYLALTNAAGSHVPSGATFSGVSVRVRKYAAPAGVGWTAQTGVGARNAVAWSPTLGILVAVTTFAAASSTDGVTWTARAITGSGYNAVAWSPDLGVFVAVGGATVGYSTDGTTWSSRSASAANAWRSVAWSPSLGLFVAVSSNGTDRVMTSPDGEVWTARSAASASTWLSVAWSPSRGLFVAVGTSAAMTSSDGINWSSQTIDVGAWRSVAWSPSLGLFVAVGTNIIATSPDGVTWTPRTNPQSNGWTSVAWSPDLGIFVAVSNNTGADRAMTSTDGVTWTARAAEVATWSGVVWAASLGLFVAVSSSGTPYVMTSPDGGAPLEPPVIEDSDVRLLIGGLPVGDNKALVGEWDDEAETVTYSWNQTELETIGVVAADINDGGFGVAVSADVTSGEARIEYADSPVTFSYATILPVYTAAFGAFPFGAAPFGGGTASSSPQDVTNIDEDRGQLFFHGGAYSTQVNPAVMEAVDAYIHGAAVRGAVTWRNRGYVGLGPTVPAQRRASVTTTSATYEDVEISSNPIYVGPLVTGPDRLWLVDVGTSDEYALRFSLTPLTSWSDRFLVGDPGVQATGLGTYGRSALVGAETGAYGFTDLGIPVRVLESLRGQRSPSNAQDIITMWGWTYITTSQGLKATIPGQRENPAGLPRSFEGKPQGLPTAIWPYKDALFMAVKDVDGDAYVLRGEFGPFTASDGQPDWYPFCVLSEETVDALFSTASRPTTGIQPSSTLLMGISDNAGYVILGRTERDIDDPDYRHTTGVMSWTGTTMIRSSNMHKNIKYFVLLCENLAGPDSLQVQVKVDNGDYVDVGDPVTSSGHKFVRPALNGVPQTDVNGHIYKPRVVFTSSQEVNPPKLRGTLDMVYDERPDEIWEHVFYVQIGQTRNAKKDIEELAGFLQPHDSGSPLEFKYPGEARTRYGFVVRVEAVEDMKGDSVQGAAITLQEWTTGHD